MHLLNPVPQDDLSISLSETGLVSIREHFSSHGYRNGKTKNQAHVILVP